MKRGPPLLPGRFSMLSCSDGDYEIGPVEIDGNAIPVQHSVAMNGYNFRFVFELWYYDVSSNQLVFAWQTPTVVRTAWTQIWFNVTMGG